MLTSISYIFLSTLILSLSFNVYLSYTLLLLSIVLCFITTKRSVAYLVILITCFVALFELVINFYAILYILLFFLITYLYFQDKKAIPFLKWVYFIIINIVIISSYLHIIPGFHNKLVIDKLIISKSSTPFSMYLNFDKVIIALILFINSNLFNQEKKDINSNTIAKISTVSFSFCLFFIALGGIFHLIHFDFKLPNILPIWIINNLFFVCFSEEVVFRGFLQRFFKNYLDNKEKKIPYLYIILPSLLFGIAHFKGGLLYVIFVSFIGALYGYVYDRTNKISYTAIIHFLFNLVHIILFTYPI